VACTPAPTGFTADSTAPAGFAAPPASFSTGPTVFAADSAVFAADSVGFVADPVGFAAFAKLLSPRMAASAPSRPGAVSAAFWVLGAGCAGVPAGALPSLFAIFAGLCEAEGVDVLGVLFAVWSAFSPCAVAGFGGASFGAGGVTSRRMGEGMGLPLDGGETLQHN
jgi:hypothetical protein